MRSFFYFVLLLFLCNSILYAENDKPIITVLDFEASGISKAEMQTTISILSSALFKTDYFTVIDVRQRETVLKELEFSLSGCSDDSCMLEVGKMLSAEAIIVGSIGRIGNKYVISAKMLETETARTLSTADGLYPDIDTLLENISQIATELSEPYKSKPVLKDKIAISEVETAPLQNEISAIPEESDGWEGVNLPAYATLSGGLAATGAGVYFLAVSLPLIFDYLGAKNSYETSTGTATEIETLWTVYEAARQTAVDGNANINFIIGASSFAVGAVLTTVSIMMFSSEESDSSVEVALLPGPGAVTLLFNLSGMEVSR